MISALRALQFIVRCAYSHSSAQLRSLGFGLPCFVLLQELLRLIRVLLAELPLQEDVVYRITVSHVALQHLSSYGIDLTPHRHYGIFKTELAAIFWVLST